MLTRDTLTPEQVAEILNVRLEIVYQALETGRLPAVKSRHQWFIKRRVLTCNVVASLQARDPFTVPQPNEMK